MLTFKVCSSQIVPPYYNDFETDTIGWHSDTILGNMWQWTTIPQLCFGMTGLGIIKDSTNHSTADVALYSPVFDFTTTANATLSLSQKFDVALFQDGTRIEYSANGLPWTLLGNYLQGTNWYNSPLIGASGLPGWTGLITVCNPSSIPLDNLEGNSTVQFRFVFCSDSIFNYNAYYLNDFCICVPPCICNNSVGINQAPLSANSVNISPNPFSDKLNLAIGNRELSEIVLCDITTRKLLQQSFTNSTSINTSQLAKGIYIYEVRNKSGVIKKGKVVKD
jgi:hypothetical protein